MMTDAEALAMIHTAADEVKAGLSAKITPATNLSEDGIFDSLDIMAFLFELETLRGGKIEAIDESYSDFRVSSLMRLLQSTAL